MTKFLIITHQQQKATLQKFFGSHEGLYLLLCNRFRDFISPTEIGSGEELVRILNKANILDEELTNKINQEKVQLVIVRSH
jgi:hypothetical protein